MFEKRWQNSDAKREPVVQLATWHSWSLPGFLLISIRKTNYITIFPGWCQYNICTTCGYVYSKPLKRKSVLHGNIFWLSTCLPCPWFCSIILALQSILDVFGFSKQRLHEHQWTMLSISGSESENEAHIAFFPQLCAWWKWNTWHCLAAQLFLCEADRIRFCSALFRETWKAGILFTCFV